MLEARWFALIDGLAASESRRRALRPDDAEEFRSYVRVRIAERGERILAAHDHRSALETYLSVVVVRMLRDWQRAVWGHWRPSAEAQRLGTIALELESRLNRSGESFESAVAAISSRFGARTSREELEQIRTRLPARAPRRQIPADALDGHVTTMHSAEEALNARERAAVARRLGSVIRRVLHELDPIDRLVLLLVFREGLSVRAVARAVGLEHKKAGRRLNRVLGQLRLAMEKAGVDRHDALLLLEAPPDETVRWLEEIADPEWDNAPPRPSSREAKS